MPFTYAGFDGKMREDQWRRVTEHLGCRYDVPGFAPSKVTGVDRTVRFGIGDAAGYGITVTNDAVVDKQLDPLAGATVRWDTIVLRINWTSNSASVVAVKGVNNVATFAPAAACKFADSDVTAGEADIPLAAAKLTSTSVDVVEVFSLRTVAQKSIVFDAIGGYTPPAAWFRYGTRLLVPRADGSYEELLRTSLGAGGWRSLTRSAPFATAAFTGTVGKAIAPGAILGPIPQEFPSGRFTAPPIVTVGYSDTRCTVSVTAVTTSGFNIYVRNLSTSNSPAPGVVSWTATQMTPTSATG